MAVAVHIAPARLADVPEIRIDADLLKAFQFALAVGRLGAGPARRAKLTGRYRLLLLRDFGMLILGASRPVVEKGCKHNRQAPGERDARTSVDTMHVPPSAEKPTRPSWTSESVSAREAPHIGHCVAASSFVM